MWVIELDDRLETDMEFENIQIDEHNNAICTNEITTVDNVKEVGKNRLIVKKWITIEEREEEWK